MAVDNTLGAGSDVNTSGKITGIDYDLLQSNYDNDGQSLIKNTECLKWIKEGSNTCAIKMSDALNKTGV